VERGLALHSVDFAPPDKVGRVMFVDDISVHVRGHLDGWTTLVFTESGFRVCSPTRQRVLRPTSHGYDGDRQTAVTLGSLAARSSQANALSHAPATSELEIKMTMLLDQARAPVTVVAVPDEA